MHDDIVAPVMKDLGEGYQLRLQLFAHALQRAHEFELYLGFPSPFQQPAHSFFCFSMGVLVKLQPSKRHWKIDRVKQQNIQHKNATINRDVVSKRCKERWLPDSCLWRFWTCVVSVLTFLETHWEQIIQEPSQYPGQGQGIKTSHSDIIYGEELISSTIPYIALRNYHLCKHWLLLLETNSFQAHRHLNQLNKLPVRDPTMQAFPKFSWCLCNREHHPLVDMPNPANPIQKSLSRVNQSLRKNTKPW